MAVFWSRILGCLFLQLLAFHWRCVSAADTDICIYTVYITSGSNPASKKSPKTARLYLCDAFKNDMWIDEIVRWGGTKGSGYDYFASSNLAIFSGSGPCLDTFVCRIRLDMMSWWKLSYVQVFINSPAENACNQTTFRDLKPNFNKGVAYIQNMCPTSDALSTNEHGNGMIKLVGS